MYSPLLWNLGISPPESVGVNSVLEPIEEVQFWASLAKFFFTHMIRIDQIELISDIRKKKICKYKPVN